MTAITKITKPGIYDLAEDVYHADPCPIPSLSKSIGATMMTQTPRHGWEKHPRLNPNYVHENKAVYDVGTAAHALVLRDGQPDEFEIVDAADWRGGDARKKRDLAWEEGRIPLLASKWNDVMQMAAAMKLQLKNHRDSSTAFTGGKAEQTIAWKIGSIWVRSRLDYAPEGRDANGRVRLDDLKSTEGSASPDVWLNRMYEMGADVQAELYTRGYCAVTGIDPNDVDFRFIVQESKPPFAVCVIGLDPIARELAKHKVDEMINLWTWCTENDSWPGYPNSTCWVAPPIREEYRFEERKARHAAAADRGESLFKQMIDWQRPVAAKP